MPNKLIFLIDDEFEIIDKLLDYILPELRRDNNKEFYMAKTLSHLKRTIKSLREMLNKEIKEEY